MSDEDRRRSGIFFLLGAGASIEAGIPSARQLAENFIKKVNAEGSEEQRALVEKVIVSAPPNLDIEWLVSVLRGVAEPGTDALDSLVNSWKFDMANEELRRCAKTLVRTIQTLLPHQLQPVHDCSYLAKLAEYAYRIGERGRDFQTYIFTLNYDLCVELALVGEHVPYETGFEEIPTWERTHFWDPSIFADVRVSLFKLHGSVNWGYVEGVPELVCRPVRDFGGDGRLNARMRRQDEMREWGVRFDPFGKIPGMIFAQHAKYLPYQPYLDLQDRFIRALTYAAAIVVIGYSWRDTYINDKIGLAVEDGLGVINIGLTAREIPGVSLSLGGGTRAALEGRCLQLKNGTAVEGGLRRVITKYFPELTPYVSSP